MKLAVVSRVRLYREGLSLVLGDEADVDVVGTVDDGPGLTALIATASPDVAIIDAALVTTTAVVQALAQARPHLRVVAFGVHEDDQEILACARAGIAGFVSDEAGTAELIRVLVAVGRGELWCSSSVAGALLRGLRPTPAEGTPPGGLTQREAEIAALVAEGLMNKQIARRLGIALSTVKNHVHQILVKQCLASRSDLASSWLGRLSPADSSAGPSSPQPVSASH